ncbi:hypothetical protein [Micromonospora sp. NPDC048830]|uniref:hypothetical protein n=1 Tax=Micromonospora sp. NPDC048830 TaxID=3364257 RepID=UPI003711E481
MVSANGRLVIIREGRGEDGSVENLVVRTGKELGVMPSPFWSIPPSPRYAITTPEQAVRAARIAATLNPSAALLTADLEDSCPATAAPRFADAVAKAGVGFPVAVLFFYREYETLAISIARSLGGSVLKSPTGQAIITLQSPQSVPSNPEQLRDAKGWVERELMGGVSYKPTVHQLPLTRAMKIAELRAAGLSSFRRLESALTFLATEVREGRAGIYPKA